MRRAERTESKPLEAIADLLRQGRGGLACALPGPSTSRCFGQHPKLSESCDVLFSQRSACREACGVASNASSVECWWDLLA